MKKLIANDVLFCPLCLGNDTYRLLFSEVSSHYAYCNNCSSFFLHDFSMITEDKYTDDYLLKSKTDQGNIKRYGDLFSYFKTTFDFNLNTSNVSFLEIGFANPGVLLKAKSSGYKCDALDLSFPNELKYFMTQKGINCFKDSALTWKPNKKYNMIWMTHVVEHFKIEDVRKLINNIYEWLEEDGIVFMSSPDADLYNSGTSHYSLLVGNFKPTEHYFLFNFDTFYSLIRDKFLLCFISKYYGETDSTEFRYFTRGEWRCLLRKRS